MLLAAAKSSSNYTLLFIFGALYIGFFFFWLRPRQKRTRAARAQAQAMEVGDKVQTIGGLIGTITSIDSHTITLKTQAGQELQFLRGAVQQRYVEPVTPSSTDSDGDSPGDHR